MIAAHGGGCRLVAGVRRPVLGVRAMSTPQDAPTRKKQKARATRKLNEWRKKQEQKAGPDHKADQSANAKTK